MGVSSNDLLHYREEPDFIDSTVTGDETSIYHKPLERNRDSTVWKHPGSLVAIQFTVTLFACTVMATAFWNKKELFSWFHLQRTKQFNADCYTETLRRLQVVICQKHVGKLTQDVNTTPPYYWENTWRVRNIGWGTPPPTTYTWHPMIFTCSGSWRNVF